MERPGAAFRSWDFAVLRKANAEWTQTISWLLLLHWFGAAVKPCQAADAKFPRVTVHDLRHTAASLMIASGANVKTVQSQLWHKTATMTLDQYGHLFPDDLDDVADKMDDLVAGCAQNVPTKNTRQSGNTL
jgi:integrase